MMMNRYSSESRAGMDARAGGEGKGREGKEMKREKAETKG